jgi:hypothetical protein
MALLLELENSTNWTLIDSQSFESESRPVGGFALPEYVPPYQFEKHILAVFIDNVEARDTWNFAGWASQKIRLGVGPSLNAESINSHKLWLRRTQLLMFPPLTTTYTLSIRFPRWFWKANCTIWEYWGPQADSIENQIFEVKNNLLRVENKVNLLLP